MVYDSAFEYEHNWHADAFTRTINLLNNLEYLASKRLSRDYAIEYTEYDWNTARKSIPGIPQQNDLSSCGFFVLMFLELRARDLPLDYLQWVDPAEKPGSQALMFQRRRLVYNMIRGRPFIFEPGHANDDQSPVHNSHDHSDQDSSPGFHQSSNAEKDKVCGDQDSKEFNVFVEGVITISSESDSDGDSYDEAPELKMSSDDSGSDSLGFSFRPSPWHFPPKSRHLSKKEEDDSDSELSVSSGFLSPHSRLQIKKEEADESDSSGFLPKSPLQSPQIEKGEGDDPPNIKPEIEIKTEDNLGNSMDQEYRENDVRNSPPPDLNQNQTNKGDVTDKCVQCGVSIHKSNFASSSGQELKCFQCQPQVFFKTSCPICDEEVENVKMQYHLEHAHHDVFVYPCKMCQVMIGCERQDAGELGEAVPARTQGGGVMIVQRQVYV